MICPRCRSDNCSRSRRSGAADHIWSVLGVKPWRCQACEKRFRGATVALVFSRYAHCPCCGNFDLQHIARSRVDWGTLIVLKRLLTWPAYRCHTCRTKFFSVLPFRRIVPSTLRPEMSRIDSVLG